MEAFKNYLKQFPQYNPKMLETLLPLLTRKEVAAGEHILQQGQICQQIAFVEHGLIRLYYLHEGKEVTTSFYLENSVTCSYSSLITQSASDLAIQALEPCQLMLLSYDSLLKLYEKENYWQQMGRLAAEKEFMILENYNRFLRDQTATERYQFILTNQPNLLQRVPLHYLATYLQIAPETLSRIRKKIVRT